MQDYHGMVRRVNLKASLVYLFKCSAVLALVIRKISPIWSPCWIFQEFDQLHLYATDSQSSAQPRMVDQPKWMQSG